MTRSRVIPAVSDSPSPGWFPADLVARGLDVAERRSDLRMVRRCEGVDLSADVKISAAEVDVVAHLTPRQFDLLYQRAFNPTASWQGKLRTALQPLLRWAKAIARRLSQPGVGEALIVSTGGGYVIMLPSYEIGGPCSWRS
jgi:hypothetical protein